MRACTFPAQVRTGGSRPLLLYRQAGDDSADERYPFDFRDIQRLGITHIVDVDKA
jgi:hypothetical protein